MMQYEIDQLNRGVSDIISAIENLNVYDIATLLVKQSPDMASELYFALFVTFQERDLNKHMENNYATE
jgi:hypothetical protein